MQAYRAISGQSLLDVALNTYGSLDNFYKLLQDNNVLNADEFVQGAQIFIWDDSLVQNQQQNAAYVASGIYFATEIGASDNTITEGLMTEDGFFILNESNQTILNG
jgi:hypothetical protein